MATALAPLVAPIVGAARTHRARLTGAARGCVSPDGSASTRVRAAACGAPACPRKKGEQTCRAAKEAPKGASGAQPSKAVEEAPKGATGAVESSAASRSVRRRRAPSPCACHHCVHVIPSCMPRCVRVCVRAHLACAWSERERVRERRQERERGARARRERRQHCRATSPTASDDRAGSALQGTPILPSGV